MYNLTHEVVVNDEKELKNILAIRVEKNVDALADSAVVTLPGMHKNAWLEVEKNVKEGDLITVSFGYDQFYNELELSGYVRTIANENNKINIACEDRLYLFRKAIANRVLTNVTALDVANYVVDEIATLSQEYILAVAGEGVEDIKFTRFVIQNATGYDVLKKLKEQSKVDIYSRWPNLYLTLRYLPDKEADKAIITYDFSKNVEKHNLRYVKAENRKVLVHMTNIRRDNGRMEVKVGTPGGDVIKLNRYNVANEQSLRRIAEEELKKWQYTGYEGNFTTWLLPYCTYGYIAHIKDERYPEREGEYYVEKVLSSFGQQGGKRQVFLGRKFSA